MTKGNINIYQNPRHCHKNLWFINLNLSHFMKEKESTLLNFNPLSIGESNKYKMIKCY
jgi:hypothetical protein